MIVAAVLLGASAVAFVIALLIQRARIGGLESELGDARCAELLAARALEQRTAELDYIREAAARCIDAADLRRQLSALAGGTKPAPPERSTT